MKHRLLPFLLAVILGAAALTACSSSDTATEDEAVNRVYPEGEGHLYTGENASPMTAPGTTAAAKTTAATQSTTKPKAAATTTAGTKPATGATKPATAVTAPRTAAAATQPTVRTNVPADSISNSNINPNIGSIQNNMQAEINAREVRSIALDFSSVTLSVGESRDLIISFNPSDAANKSCTLTTDNQNINASLSGKTVTVTGVASGTSTLTVTSNNGHQASCSFTVKRNEADITDDTVLPHAELVTAANAERWTQAVAERLESLGMTHNTTLQGSSVTLTTVGENNKSFNDSLSDLTAEAQAQVKRQLDGDWQDYEFNCVCRVQDGGDFSIVIAVNQL